MWPIRCAQVLVVNMVCGARMAKLGAEDWVGWCVHLILFCKQVRLLWLIQIHVATCWCCYSNLGCISGVLWFLPCCGSQQCWSFVRANPSVFLIQMRKWLAFYDGDIVEQQDDSTSNWDCKKFHVPDLMSQTLQLTPFPYSNHGNMMKQYETCQHENCKQLRKGNI